jgi:hypothetical protein
MNTSATLGRSHVADAGGGRSLPQVPTATDARRPATVLHTSDCHLGSGAHGREERAFAQAIDLARRERVDAVLMAGDLFDSARMSDETLEWTAAQFDTLTCLPSRSRTS